MKKTTNLHNKPMKILAMIFVSICNIPMANASFSALESTRGVGNQGFNGSLGMHFDVLSSINVTQLGAFDSKQDGFSSEISVGIFDRTTQSLVTEIALFNGTSNTLIGQSRFIDIVDVVLDIGDYSIVAQGFNSSNLNGNAHDSVNSAPTINTGSGLISFVGGGYFNSSSVLDYPLIADDGPANRYDAGTFQFEAVSTVPVPAAVWLFGSALIGLIGIRKKSSKNIMDPEFKTGV